jgi:hypothetical protein
MAFRCNYVNLGIHFFFLEGFKQQRPHFYECLYFEQPHASQKRNEKKSFDQFFQKAESYWDKFQTQM